VFGFEPNNKYEIEIKNDGIIDKLSIRSTSNYDDKVSPKLEIKWNIESQPLSKN